MIIALKKAKLFVRIGQKTTGLPSNIMGQKIAELLRNL